MALTTNSVFEDFFFYLFNQVLGGDLVLLGFLFLFIFIILALFSKINLPTGFLLGLILLNSMACDNSLFCSNGNGYFAGTFLGDLLYVTLALASFLAAFELYKLLSRG